MNYFNLIKVLIQKSIQIETAFRTNFFINIFNTIITFTGSLMSIYILFNQIQKLNGWTFEQALALIGVYLLVDSLSMVVISPSLDALAGMDGEIWVGKFDFTLLKPIPTQLFISIRNWNIWPIVDILLSSAIILYALINLSHAFMIINLIIFLGVLLTAMIIIYSILLFLSSCAFWYLGTPLMWIYNSLKQLGKYPVGIYPGWLKIILTWIIPIGFIITIPAKVLIGSFTILELIMAAGFAFVIFIFASLFFAYSLRRYTSASS